MVLGYYDNYVAGVPGHSICMGKLVDYWREASVYRNGTGGLSNVPNTLLELAKAMGTSADGGTYISRIARGMRGVANTKNQCTFTTDVITGDSSNDYGWPTLTSEIAASRPVVWSVGTSSVGHSLCAWGYTDSKYVLVFNTWNYGRDDWYYRKYYNGPILQWQYVNTAVPGGNVRDDDQLFIAPLKSRSFFAGSHLTIRWKQQESRISKAAIYYSIDGGNHWTTIKWRKSHHGWNYYTWTVPNKPTSRARIKVMGFYGSRNIANDGLKKNFRIRSH
jgi:hypothetical protein